jgi:hypothetical protein
VVGYGARRPMQNTESISELDVDYCGVTWSIMFHIEGTMPLMHTRHLRLSTR